MNNKEDHSELIIRGIALNSSLSDIEIDHILCRAQQYGLDSFEDTINTYNAPIIIGLSMSHFKLNETIIEFTRRIYNLCQNANINCELHNIKWYIDTLNIN